MLEGADFALIGRVKADKIFKVKGTRGGTVINADIKSLKTAWQKPFSGL